MKDFIHHGHNESGLGGNTARVARDADQIDAAPQRNAWAGRAADADRCAQASVTRRWIGLAAVLLGGVLMVAGAAMVAAAVL